MFVNAQFVEEEVIVDVKYMNAGAPRMMLWSSKICNEYRMERSILEGYESR